MASLPVNDHYVFVGRRGISLPIDAKVYVAIPENAVSLPFSSTMSHLLGQQLALYIPDVQVGSMASSVSSSLIQAQHIQSDFLVYPKIIIQEEKKSSVSEIADDYESLSSIGLDRVWIQISVWDVNAQSFVDSTQIKGRSAPLQLSQNHSNDLIASAMKQYAHRLIAKY